MLFRSGYRTTQLPSAAAKSIQSCPTLCDPIDGSPSGSTIPGILQARTLEWVAISFPNYKYWTIRKWGSILFFFSLYFIELFGSCIFSFVFVLLFSKQVHVLEPITYAAAAAAKSLQSCPTLCDPTDISPPGSPVPGILQARTLEWVAISFSNA